VYSRLDSGLLSVAVTASAVLVPVTVPGVAAALVIPGGTSLKARLSIAPLRPEVAPLRLSHQVISTFTQPFPYAPYRVTNIGRAARYIDGTQIFINLCTAVRGFFAGGAPRHTDTRAGLHWLGHAKLS